MKSLGLFVKIIGGLLKIFKKCALLAKKLPKYVHDILFSRKFQLFSRIFDKTDMFVNFYENFCKGICQDGFLRESLANFYRS
jgi:hypothetical protein